MVVVGWKWRESGGITITTRATEVAEVFTSRWLAVRFSLEAERDGFRMMRQYLY